jgi:hypothetical protein
MDFCLHDHPILPPTVPLVEAEGGDVHSWTLGPVLEVVATERGRTPLRKVQHMEELKRMHRRPHTHVHLIEVDEDRHKHDGLRRQVMELKTVILQKREGGEQKYEPRQGLRR